MLPGLKITKLLSRIRYIIKESNDLYIISKCTYARWLFYRSYHYICLLLVVAELYFSITKISVKDCVRRKHRTK